MTNQIGVDAEVKRLGGRIVSADSESVMISFPENSAYCIFLHWLQTRGLPFSEHQLFHVNVWVRG